MSWHAWHFTIEVSWRAHSSLHAPSTLHLDKSTRASLTLRDSNAWRLISIIAKCLSHALSIVHVCFSECNVLGASNVEVARLVSLIVKRWALTKTQWQIFFVACVWMIFALQIVKVFYWKKSPITKVSTCRKKCNHKSAKKWKFSIVKPNLIALEKKWTSKDWKAMAKVFHSHECFCTTTKEKRHCIFVCANHFFFAFANRLSFPFKKKVHSPLQQKMQPPKFSRARKNESFLSQKKFLVQKEWLPVTDRVDKEGEIPAAIDIFKTFAPAVTLRLSAHCFHFSFRRNGNCISTRSAHYERSSFNPTQKKAISPSPAPFKCPFFSTPLRQNCICFYSRSSGEVWSHAWPPLSTKDALTFH